VPAARLALMAAGERVKGRGANDALFGKDYIYQWLERLAVNLICMILRPHDFAALPLWLTHG